MTHAASNLRYFLTVAAALSFVIYAFILTLDPYQNVPFSPSLPRAPVSQNQRFAYPSIARNPDFDGLIIGTSTTRLLDPKRIGDSVGRRFANLSMNSATTYEQQRIHELFARHHPDMRYLVVGVDETWCNRQRDPARYTFRTFPEWMYDDNRWNDLLYMFNDKALENAVRMLELISGNRSPKYRPDGYRDFTADFGEWDETAVKRRLFKHGSGTTPQTDIRPTMIRPNWDFPLLENLQKVLDGTPREAEIIVLLPPLHGQYLAPKAEMLAECKGRILQPETLRRSVHVLDYMFASAITTDIRNYWDSVHFTSTIAQVIESDIAHTFAGQFPSRGDVRHANNDDLSSPPAASQ